MSNVSDYLNTGLDTALAIDRIWKFGGDRSSNVDLTKERISLGKLNGSGPVNPADALAAELRLDTPNNLMGGGMTGGISVTMLALVGVAVSALLYLAMRSR